MGNARLFVYGSLKRGGRHHDLMSRARFLGEAETVPGFGLVTVAALGGEYSALVERPGSSTSVPGELFEVDGARLRILDEFEGENYARAEVRVLEMSGEIRLALAYMMKPR